MLIFYNFASLEQRFPEIEQDVLRYLLGLWERHLAMDSVIRTERFKSHMQPINTKCQLGSKATTFRPAVRSAILTTKPRRTVSEDFFDETDVSFDSQYDSVDFMRLPNTECRTQFCSENLLFTSFGPPCLFLAWWYFCTISVNNVISVAIGNAAEREGKGGVGVVLCYWWV